MAPRAIPTGSRWIGQIFKAQAAKNGGVVRRSVDSVKTYATIRELEAEVRARRFHLLRSGDQYLIFCHIGVFKVLC